MTVFSGFSISNSTNLGRLRVASYTTILAMASWLVCAGTAWPAGQNYSGTLTLARDGANDPFAPRVIVDLDLASNKLEVRFDGFDPQRTRTGEFAYITRLTQGYIADYGVVTADARGVPSAPLYVCSRFSFNSNRICHTPKLSPDGQRVAFGMAASGGTVCKDAYGTRWADYVVVEHRKGGEITRFEGYYYPEWLPDGRLLMLGSQCRGAGVWIADPSLRGLTRVDGNQVEQPAMDAHAGRKTRALASHAR